MATEGSNRFSYERYPMRNAKPKGVSRAFLSDLFSYFRLRGMQTIRFSMALFSLSILSFSKTKGVVIRKMYWGRTSFYRFSFQIIIAVITGGALITSVAIRMDVFGKEEEGIDTASGIIGNNDIFLQVGTTDAITEAEASGVDYEITKYEVKPGDTLSAIAQDFGVSADTIRWANKIPAGRDTLTVGQILDIPPMNGVLYTVERGDTMASVIRKVKGANEFDLIELNNLQAPNYTLTVGQKLFIPDATYTPPVVATSRTRRSTSTSGSGGTFVDAGNTSVNVPRGTFVNPMQQCAGYGFARGWRYSHTGVDLTHSPGCWIVAAGSGTVTKAGWCSGGMGFCTVVKHDNGFTTLYMHGQGKFAVRAGERVGAGQRIMTLGNTGNSYGPHLHLSLAAPGTDVLNYRSRINPAGIVPY